MRRVIFQDLNGMLHKTYFSVQVTLFVLSVRFITGQQNNVIGLNYTYPVFIFHFMVLLIFLQILTFSVVLNTFSYNADTRRQKRGEITVRLFKPQRAYFDIGIVQCCQSHFVKRDFRCCVYKILHLSLGIAQYSRTTVQDTTPSTKRSSSLMLERISHISLLVGCLGQVYKSADARMRVSRFTSR